MDANTLWQDIERIHAAAPLVHNITNYVVMNTTANALLAIGASPVMAHALEEVEELVALSGALVLNIGTLSPAWVQSMFRAGIAANNCGIPVILDPVGCGATSLRTTTAQRLLSELSPAIVRGNASEIMALAGGTPGTKGVDSTNSAEESEPAVRALAEQSGCTLSVSGPTDLIIGQGHTIRVRNGHPIMPRITGLGCTATAITGAFAAINPSPFQAAAHAMALMGIAGAMAAEQSAGPGTFQPHFLDTLYNIKKQDIEQRLQIQE